jgi:hypothetical protein
MALERHTSRWNVLFPAGTPVVALPDWRRPRLLVPARTSRQIWRGTRFYPAYRWTGRLFHLALRLRAMARLAPRAATPPTLDGERDRLEDFLTEVAPVAVIAVQVGMPGGAQKLTARLVDTDDRVVGFLKCAEQPLARSRLRNEYDVLRRLPPGVGPTPLKFGTVRGLDVLLLAPVAGRHPRATMDPPPALHRLLASLATPQRATIEQHPWARALGDGLASVAPVASAVEALAGRAWPVTFRHGDLAPWNLLRAPDGRLVAIDWEYGSATGLPGLDLAQYMLQVALLVVRCSPEAALDRATRALQSAAALDGPPLSRRESAALAVLAAYETYRASALEGLTDRDPRQVWRRAVWAAPLP